MNNSREEKVHGHLLLKGKQSSRFTNVETNRMMKMKEFISYSVHLKETWKLPRSAMLQTEKRVKANDLRKIALRLCAPVSVGTAAVSV